MLKRILHFSLTSTNKVPMLADRDTWPEFTMVKDSFSAMVNALPVKAAAPFQSMRGTNMMFFRPCPKTAMVKAWLLTRSPF